MSEQIFYDVHEQTKYRITFSRPERMEDLSDLFVTQEEMESMVGNFYANSTGKRSIILKKAVQAEVMKWGEKLVKSGKKTLQIDDEDLLDVLKQGYLTDYTDNGEFGRHGDRICFARRYKRKKTKVTKGDVNDMWAMLTWAFYDKFKCYPSHIPRYDRGLNMFKAFKSIVGWRRMRRQMNDEYVKFYRQIWDNPEEHI